jgi:hypothetical protein
MAGARVAVRDQTGNLGTVDESELSSALDAGYSRVSQTELVRAERQERFSTPGQKAQLVGERLASAWSGGATDVLMADMFGDQYRDDALARTEENPWLSTGTELTGSVGMALLGGVGGASKLAGGAPGLFSRAGAGVENLVTRGLGAESMGARLLAKAAGAATEGALFEGAAEISRSALRDETITGEKLVAAMGRGGVLGGGLGLGGALLGEGKSALARMLTRADDGAAAAESRAAALTSAEMAGKAESRSSVLSSLDDQLDVTAGGGTSKVEISGLDTLRGTDPEVAAALKRAESREVALRDLTDEADRLAFRAAETRNAAADATGALQDGVLRGAAKDRHMVRLVDESKAPEAVQRAQDVIDELKRVVEDAAADPTKWPAAVTRKLDQTVGNYEARLLREVEAKEGVAGRVFVTLDDLKYDIGKIASKAHGYAGETLQSHAYNRVMRDALEDERIWGRAAQSQKTINPKYAEWIGFERRASQAVEYGTGARVTGDSFDELYRADPAAYKTAFRHVGEAESYATLQVLRDQARATKELAEAAQKAYPLTPEQQKLVQTMRQSTDDYERVVREAEDNIGLIRKTTKEEAKGGGLAADAAQLVPGAGATIAMVLSQNPVTIARRQQAVAKAVARAESLFGGRLFSWISSAAKSGGGGLFGGKRATPKLPGGGSGGGTKMSSGTLPAALVGMRAQRLVEQRREELQRLENDPQHAATIYAKGLGELPDIAPKTAASVMATIQRGNAFLLSKLPPVPTNGNQLTPQFGTQPAARAAAEEYARYDRAVYEPATVLDDLARGTLTPQAVEALRVVHPEMYEDLRSVAQVACAELKNPLPYSHRVRLSVLLDIQGDATQAPEFLAQTQATFAMKKAEEQPAIPMQPGDLSRGLRSEMSTIEGEVLV